MSQAVSQLELSHGASGRGVCCKKIKKFRKVMLASKAVEGSSK